MSASADPTMNPRGRRKNRKKRRSIIKRLLVVGGLVIVLALAGLWFSVQHVPVWYQPMVIAPQNVQAIRNDFVQAHDELNELMLRSNEPFDYKISQDRLNSWISIREGIWPEVRDWLPSYVQNPFVTFDEQGLRVAATISQDSLRTVLSVRFAVTADKDNFHIQLTEVQSGSLPVPEAVVRAQLEKLDQEGWNLETFGYNLRNQPRPEDLLKGISWPNSSAWKQVNLSGSDHRQFAVTGVRFEEGAVTLTIQPLGAVSSRKAKK